MAYCTRQDVYLLGLSTQAFVSRPRPFDAVDATTATVRLKAHGLSSLDIITFEVTAGGALPTGISAFAPYYPYVVTSDLLRISTTAGGSPIASWVTAGSGWGIAIDPGRRLDANIVATAAEIDEHLTAHEPPIQVDPVTGLYPQILVAVNARMAARATVPSLQIENAAYRVQADRLIAMEAFDRQVLADWKKGKPVHPNPTDLTSVADNSAHALASRAPLNWTQGYL
jgi:hypothetical protein